MATKILSFEEILKEGNEGHDFRAVIDGLDDDQILECIEQYKDQFARNLSDASDADIRSEAENRELKFDSDPADLEDYELIYECESRGLKVFDFPGVVDQMKFDYFLRNINSARW